MKSHLLLIVTVLLLSACSGYQYVASPQYVPLHEKKGELKAVASYNTLQVGYSVSDHVNIFGTANYRKQATSSWLNAIGSKENGGAYTSRDEQADVNIGTGYFITKNKFIVEALIGTGIGKVTYGNIKDLFTDYQFTMAANKINVFLQPAFGYKVKNNFEVAFFTRFIYADYYNIKTTTKPGDLGTVDDRDKYFAGRTKADLFFAEPGVMARVGSKNIKFNTILSPVINLTGEHINYRSANISFGVFLNFELLTRKE